MNACITNSSEVLCHGLGPFSHCYAKRTHFIFSCLSYVAFVFDLGKQNTSMRTCLCNFKFDVVLEQFFVCQFAHTLKTALSWKIDYFSIFQQMEEKELSNSRAMLRGFFLIFSRRFLTRMKRFENHFPSVKEKKKLFKY